MYNSFKISFHISTTSGTRANNVSTRLGCLYTRPLQRKGGPWVKHDSGLTVPLLKNPYNLHSSFLISASDGMGGERHAPSTVPPGKETRYPLYRRLGGAPVPVWTRAERFAYHWDSNPRTVQSVASRYTDWATPIHLKHITSTLMRCHPRLDTHPDFWQKQSCFTPPRELNTRALYSQSAFHKQYSASVNGLITGPCSNRKHFFQIGEETDRHFLHN